MGFGKEYWLRAFEEAVEDIAKEKEIDEEEAEGILQKRLDENRNYLDGYLEYDLDECGYGN